MQKAARHDYSWSPRAGVLFSVVFALNLTPLKAMRGGSCLVAKSSGRFPGPLSRRSKARRLRQRNPSAAPSLTVSILPPLRVPAPQSVVLFGWPHIFERELWGRRVFGHN